MMFGCVGCRCSRAHGTKYGARKRSDWRERAEIAGLFCVANGVLLCDASSLCRYNS